MSNSQHADAAVPSLDLYPSRPDACNPQPLGDECETYSTNEFAALGGFEPQTARKSYSAAGHYLNVVPKKLPNKRLRWPKAQVQALYRG